MILRRKNGKHIIVQRYDETTANDYQRAEYARVCMIHSEWLLHRLRSFGYMPRSDMARKTIINAVLTDDGTL